MSKIDQNQVFEHDKKILTFLFHLDQKMLFTLKFIGNTE